MVTIENKAGTFTPTVDTLVQNISTYSIYFQTDDTAEAWASLDERQWLEIPAGKTVYFKTNYNGTINLPTVEL